LFYFIKIKVFLAISLLFISTPLLSCTLVLAVSDDFPPYHMRHADNTWSGVSIDIARLLVTKAGCELAVLEKKERYIY